MSAGKNILLVFVSIVLVVFLFLFGILWGFNQFLYPGTYENALEENNAYNLVNILKIDGGEFVKLPPGGTKTLINGLLENILSYLRGDSEELNLTVEINRERINELFLEGMKDFPVCLAGEEPFIGNEPNCIPENMESSVYIEEALEKNNITIYDSGKVNLAEVFGINEENTYEIKNYIKIYRYILYGILVLLAGLVILLFFVSDKRIKWLGSGFLIAGILLFTLGYFLLPMIIEIIPSEGEFFSSIAGSLIDSLFLSVRTYAIIIAGTGIVAFVLSFLIKRNEDNKKEEKEK